MRECLDCVYGLCILYILLVVLSGAVVFVAKEKIAINCVDTGYSNDQHPVHNLNC